YVVVIKSSGPGAEATREYVDALYERWRSQAVERGLALDHERSILIVAALDKHQVAVHPGRTLQKRLGMTSDPLKRDLLRPAFFPMAQAEKYPEAMAALLNATDRWIAAGGVPALQAKAPATAPPPVASTSPAPRTQPGTAQPGAASLPRMDSPQGS